jgi:hypothetical protein
LLLEYRAQQLDDEFHRRFIVIVKDYLEVADLGLNVTRLNITHWKLPLLELASLRPIALGRSSN